MRNVIVIKKGTCVPFSLVPSGCKSSNYYFNSKKSVFFASANRHGGIRTLKIAFFHVRRLMMITFLAFLNEMEVSAQVIADHLGGEIIGDPAVKVSSVAKIESGRPGNICFLANPKYERYLYTCNASVILLNRTFELKEPVRPTVIRVDNAYEAVASLLDLLNSLKKGRRRGRALSARISLGARIGKGVWVGSFSCVGRKSVIGKGCQIYPQVYIGDDVVLGEDCVLYPGVKIYQGCRIGDRCILHANVVIGSDGFGFAPTPDGSYKKIPQTGTVTLEDDVEIGANTVVDRATMGSTVIGKGVKLDNLIQIAHNVTVGANTVMAAQSGIAGSSHVGAQCQIGGQVGISGHLTIADGTQIAAQAGVLGDIREKSVVMGSPAFEYKDFLRAYAIFRRNARNSKNK